MSTRRFNSPDEDVDLLYKALAEHDLQPLWEVPVLDPRRWRPQVPELAGLLAVLPLTSPGGPLVPNGKLIGRSPPEPDRSADCSSRDPASSRSSTGLCVSPEHECLESPPYSPWSPTTSVRLALTRPAGIGGR